MYQLLSSIDFKLIGPRAFFASIFAALIILGTVLLGLGGCAQVQIKDSEWYGSLGILGAAGFHTLTNDTERLNIQQWAVKWDDLQHPLVCTSVDTLADWKGDIEKLCSFNSNECTYQVQQAVNAFYAKISAATGAAQSFQTLRLKLQIVKP